MNEKLHILYIFSSLFDLYWIDFPSHTTTSPLSPALPTKELNMNNISFGEVWL